jgi:hypothetical protein
MPRTNPAATRRVAVDASSHVQATEKDRARHASPSSRQNPAVAMLLRQLPRSKAALRHALLDGFVASVVSAVLSGVPSLLYFYRSSAGLTDFLNGYVSESLAAAGNVLLHHSHAQPVLIAAGIVAHCILAFVFTIITSLLTANEARTDRMIIKCVALAVFFHFQNLFCVPMFWNMPLIEQLLKKTTAWPHFYDHLSFGLSNALTLIALRKARTHSHKKTKQ